MRPTLALLTLIASLALGCVKAQGIGIAPVRDELQLTPGQRSERSLDLLGRGAPTPVVIELVDWLLMEDGRIVFFPAGTLERSLAPWIRVNTGRVQLNEKLTIRYSVTLPETAQGSYWAALLFRPPALTTNQGTTRVGFRGSLFYPIYATAKGTEDIRLTLSKVATANGQRAFELFNAGNAVVRFEAKLVDLDARGQVVNRVETEDVILPDGRLRLVFDQAPTEAAATRLTLYAEEKLLLAWEGAP